MKVEFSEQYSKCCLVLEGTEDAQAVMDKAYEDECVYFDGEDDCFVVRFPDRPQELYTETALRGSLPVGKPGEPRG